MILLQVDLYLLLDFGVSAAMEGEPAGDFHDWELLHDSDSPTSVHILCDFEEIEEVSEAMIQADYFSIDGSSRYANHTANGECCGSDNLSRADSGAYKTQFPRKYSGQFCSDSGSDISNKHCKVRDFDSNSEMKEQVALRFTETSELGGKDGKLGHEYDESKVTNLDLENEIIQRGFEDRRESEHLDKDSGKNQLLSDSVGDELVVVATDSGANESIVEEKECSDQSDEHGHGAAIEEEEFGGGEEVNRRRIARWKVPFELLLRYYSVLRVNRVWSLSVAAAVVGFVILGRKLYRMKNKKRTLQLKVTVDNRKVSQFATRAARLNEVYSVVRHVSMIRPTLPASGVALMSLR